MWSPKNIEKVIAYLTRENVGQSELLVFEHCDSPEAGIQVPAGTVQAGEEISRAVLREVQEESGLVFLGDIRHLGRFEWFRQDRSELHFRNVFHLPTTGRLRDEWLHSVGGEGEDQKMLFRFYWIPLENARAVLAVDQGMYLPHCRGATAAEFSPSQNK